MLVDESEDDSDAPHMPSATTPTKSRQLSSCSSGACHGKSEVKTESEEEDSYLEQECDKPQRKTKLIMDGLITKSKKPGPPGNRGKMPFLKGLI
jgi:hypothetical protein